MDIKPEIRLKQTQKLVMTPQLQQAIKMLQLSNMELSQKIEEELIENPALEIDEGEDEYEKEIISNEIEANENDDGSENLEDEYFYEDKNYSHTEDRSLGNKKREFIEGTVFREETLKEYLLWQIRLLKISPEDFRTYEILIGYIDAMGYLSIPLKNISNEVGLPLEKLEKVLKIIQGLDPPGVGARDIKECLMIQLKNRGNFPIVEKIILEFLNEIKLRKFEEISKKLKITQAKVREAFSIMAKLEPYPGRQFYSGEIKYIIPEVIVEEREGNFEVISNNSFIPKLRINSYYKNLLKRKTSDKRIKGFVSEKVQRAKNFIHWIDQRESTLVRVTKAILEEQIDFFRDGPKHLKPLILKDISDKVDLHESTISRITSSKYVQTPFGVFQLKYFFSTTIPAYGSKEYSSTSIKEMIKDIVHNEKSKRHFSDQKIADLLAVRGIKIARRTVAKYRKGLKILPSNLRRE